MPIYCLVLNDSNGSLCLTLHLNFLFDPCSLNCLLHCSRSYPFHRMHHCLATDLFCLTFLYCLFLFILFGANLNAMLRHFLFDLFTVYIALLCI